VAKFPYLVSHTHLKPFLAKIQDVGTPSVVDKKWRTTVGFGSENDARMLPLLEFIGFIDSSGKPLPRWQAYRNTSRAKLVMAQGVREGYADLFHTYPDAYARSDSELGDYFRSASGSGSATINRMITAFRLLCDLADFTSETGAEVAPESPKSPQAMPGAKDAPADPPDATADGTDNFAASNAAGASIRTVTRTLATGVTLNINIQLTVPDTTDEKVYDNFFAALKKHLLT
jgi:hypothetical protein